MADPNRINFQLRQLANSGQLSKFDFLWSDKAINIFPSNPISNIPALSLNSPARLQKSKGTASLRAESRT